MTLKQRRDERLRSLQLGVASGQGNGALPRGGPGTELRRLLHLMGIQPRGADCKCNEHAKLMDERGASWCEAHVEEIVDWLEAEAKTRPLAGLLFVRVAAKQLVRLAIRRAVARGI